MKKKITFVIFKLIEGFVGLFIPYFIGGLFPFKHPSMLFQWFFGISVILGVVGLCLLCWISYRILFPDIVKWNWMLVEKFYDVLEKKKND